MIPTHALATDFVPSTLLSPDSFNSVPLTEDYEIGGIDVDDASEGNTFQDWKGVLANDVVTLFPLSNPSNSTAIALGQTATEFTFTFDQSMRPVIAFSDGTDSFIRYFNSVNAQFEVLEVTGAVSPFVSLDDKRFYGVFTGTNDVLLFYILDGDLCYRQQRESYGTERVLYENIPGAAARIAKAGMDNKYRMHVEVQLYDNFL